jgi:hypothetical protein
MKIIFTVEKYYLLSECSILFRVLLIFSSSLICILIWKIIKYKNKRKFYEKLIYLLCIFCWNVTAPIQNLDLDDATVMDIMDDA